MVGGFPPARPEMSCDGPAVAPTFIAPGRPPSAARFVFIYTLPLRTSTEAMQLPCVDAI